MFRNTFQSGFLSILYSLGNKPLQLWDKQVENGAIKRVADDEVQSGVLEITGDNVAFSHISCPADPAQALGIKLPFLVLVVKSLRQRYFTFEVQVLDDKGLKRRLRASNFQSTTRVKPAICSMPLRLDEGTWNHVQLNLADVVRRAYGTAFVEVLRVQIHANCRLRRVFFADRQYGEEELPPEFRLFQKVDNGSSKRSPQQQQQQQQEGGGGGGGGSGEGDRVVGEAEGEVADAVVERLGGAMDYTPGAAGAASSSFS